MSTEVHVEPERVVVSIGTLPDDRMLPLLGQHIRGVADDGRVVIDLSEVVLRPADIRAIAALLDEVEGRDVWVCCSRLAGRQLLKRFLDRPCNVVRSCDEVPRSAPSSSGPPLFAGAPCSPSPS